MSINFYYCKGDGFHAVIEERNEKFATEYFVYLMNELLEPEKGIIVKDVTCEAVNVYNYKAAQQSAQADLEGECHCRHDWPAAEIGRDCPNCWQMITSR